MRSYQKETYGERIADVYDEWYESYDPMMIKTLGELAQKGSALELGVGTGRIALPLQEAGIKIYGIDASESMLAILRAKHGGDAITVIIGDFAEMPVEGKFDLVYVVFNTFFALLTQDEQIRCFHNAAKHLKPGGVFVLEGFVPDLTRFTGKQALRTVSIADQAVRIDASQVDLASQTITSQHIVLTETGVQFYPVKLRFAWPSELDIMARLVSLKLLNRWSNWDKSPFTSDSTKHISVYGK